MTKKFDNVEYFAGLDIGSDSCKASVARVCSWETMEMEIIAVAEKPSGNAVERGCIVNIENASNVVEDVLSELHDQMEVAQSEQDGLHTMYGVLSIKDKYLNSRVNNATYPFNKRPIEVSAEHLQKARDMASNYPVEHGRDYLHIMTRNYRVDNRLPRLNPEGELGMSLEAEVFLLSASRQELANNQQCALRANFPLEYMCAGPIAAAEGILTRVEREQSTVLIDIGSDTSSAILFEGGVPKVLSVVPFGGRDVTRDLSHMLHIPEGLAEILKKTRTCVDELYFSQFPETLVLKDDEYDQVFSIEASKVYQIAHARMYETLKLLYSSMDLLNSAHAYPVAITGGGVRILGCSQMISKLTGAKVRMAQPWNWGGPFGEYRNPKFSTSIGLCSVAAQHYNLTHFSKGKELMYSNGISDPSGMKIALQNFGSRFKDFFSFGDI